MQAAHFTGRNTEFAQLSAALEKALNGQGGLYFIGGESGVGKSRLLTELRHLAMVKGTLVLNGQAVREGALLYQAWRESIRRLTLNGSMSDDDAQNLKPIIPDLERLLGRSVTENNDDENIVQRINTALLNLFRAYREPIVLLLEDWQWAHTESREALKRLQEYALGAPLLIVATYRNDEAPTLPAQYPGSTTLVLERLNLRSIEELASSILGQRTLRSEFIETLHRHTEGNVFFLIESIRALAEDAGRLEDVVNVTLPESLITGGMERIIQRRIDKLPKNDRPLLEKAALAGRELNLKLLRDLNQNSRIDFEDWLTRASNAAILEYRDEVWRFSHDKMRQHVINQISASRQKTMHKDIAESIERLYPAVEQASTLVRHWGAAENAGKELHYIRMAGEQATRYNNYEESRQLYERALTLTTSPLFLIEFNTLLAGACEFLGLYERGMQCLEIVLTLGRKHKQPTALAKAAHELAWIHMRQGDMTLALQNATEALAMARESNHALLTVRALSVLGVIHVIQGESTQSREALEQAIPLVKTLDNAYLHATILNTLGAAYEGEGRVEEAITVLKQAGQMAEDLRDRELLANVHGNLGRIVYIQKQSLQAEESFFKALPGFTEVGNVYGAALANTYLGLIATQRYDTRAAKSYFRAGIDTSRSIGAQTISLLCLCGIAQIFLREGNMTKVAELIGVIQAHPVSMDDVDITRELMTLINQADLSESELEAGLMRGQVLDFEVILTQEFEALSDSPASN